MMRLAPGSPFTGERNLPPAVLANIEAKYHLNDPLYLQYFHYLKQLAQGDFGPSFKYKDYTVNELLAQAFPVSLELGIYAFIVALLLAAALMHASWNALLKADRSDRLATFGVIMTTGTVMGLVAVPFLPWIHPGAWKFLALSVIIHVAYYTFLLKAYSYGDLSHTYPIARGLGPLLVALVSGRLIGEHLREQDIAGVLLLSFGLVALAMPLKAAVPRPGSRHEPRPPRPWRP